MEQAVAALIPALAALAATVVPLPAPRGEGSPQGRVRGAILDDLRRAIRLWFVPLALLWLAPSWLTGRTPMAFDRLGEIWPWHALATAPPRGNPLLSDALFQFLPWRHGDWRFLWTNPQAALLFPLTWLGKPFSDAAWPLFAGEAKLLIAATGTYLFLRREGRSHHAAILGAVAFAFGVGIVALLFVPQTNVMVMLPWMFVAVQRPHALGAVAFFLAAVGGHPETFVYATIAAALFALRRGRRVAARAAIVALAGIALAAPMLVPFASVVGESARMTEFMRHPELGRAPALTLTNLAGYVAPSLLRDRIAAMWYDNFNAVATQYVGIATLLLAIYAARREKFWAAVFLVCSLLAFDIVPAFGPMLHGRMRFVIAFATAVMAARGLDALGRWRVALPLIVAADLFLNMFNFYPPVETKWAYPSTPAIRAMHGRIVAVGLTMAPNTAMVYGLDDVGRHDPMAWEPYLRVLESAGYDRRDYFSVFHGIPPRAFLNFLGVRYVVVPPDVAGTPPLPVVYRGRDAIVLSNPGALPRFFVAPGAPPASLDVRGDTIDVRAPAATAIASNEADIPGWTLTRDGVEEPIVRVGGAFIGWRVPPGAHRYELRYLPPRLGLGIVVALLGIALITVTLRRP